MQTTLRAFLLLLFTFTLSTATAQWAWLNPKPSGHTGTSITFVNDKTGFFVNGADLVQTKDAGTTWEVKQSMTRGNEIKFKGQTGFVVGDFGTVYQTTDLGENWQKLTISTTENLNSVNVLHPDTIYITGSKSLITTTNAGKTWSIKVISPAQSNAPQPSSYTITKSFFINSKVGHATCTNGSILKTINGGESWYVTESTNTFPSSYFTILFVNSKVGFASKQHSTLMKTTDGGETWVPLSIRQMSSAAYTLHFLNEQIGYLAGDHGAMYKTADGGNTWAWIGFQNAFIDGTSMYGVYFKDVNVGYAVGMRGRIIKTTDGGMTWTSPAFTYHNITDMAFPTSTTGYATGAELYKTTDKGQSWQTLNTGLDESNHYYRLTQFFSADTGYVVAHAGSNSNSSDILIKTTDGGKTWTKFNIHMYVQRFGAMHFLNNRVGYLSTSDRHYGYGFLKTTDGGHTWQKVSGFSNASKMHFTSINNGLAIRDGDLYRTTDGGVTWAKTREVYGSLTAFSFVNDKVGYVSAEYGVVLKTKDGGATWEELKTEYEHLKSVTFYSENIGYVLGGSGKNFRTLDGGYTWESVSIPALVTKLIITKDNDMFASGSYGRILKGTFEAPAYSLRVLPATKIAADGAELTGVAASNSGTLTNIRLEYGKSMFFDKSIPLTPAQVAAHSGERYTYTLNDLDPGIRYNYRIRATHNGTEHTSNIAEFTTLAAFEVSAGPIYSLTSTGGELNGRITSYQDEITAIQFEYATDNTFTNSTSLAATPDMVQAKKASGLTAQLRELKPGTQYFTRLKFTHKGKTHYSAVYSFTTRPEYLITMLAPSVTQAGVSWRARVESNNGDISKLAFEYGKTRDFGMEAAASPDAVPNDLWRTIQVSLTDLEPDTVYYFRVKGMQGEKAIHSSVHMFRASGGAVLVPDQAIVEGNSVLLSGFVAPQGVMVSDLRIEYGETPAMGNSVAATPTFLYTGTGKVQAEVKDLAPGTVYYYRIKGTVSGEALYSTHASFATAAPTGITDEEDRKLTVYPNPTQDRLFFSHQDVMQRIEVYNQVGKLVLSVQPGAAQYMLDLSKQAPGIYHIRIHHKANVHIRKVVKL